MEAVHPRNDKGRLLKAERKRRLETDRCYRLVALIARIMDRFYLDPVIGFVFPTAGDIFSTLMTVPYLYLALFRIRSVALALAIMYNTLKDLVISLIPLGIGDLLDIFNRSYRRNYRLITGFLEDNTTIVREVNRKAWKAAAGCVILVLLLVGLIYLTCTLIGTTWDLLTGLFS